MPRIVPAVTIAGLADGLVIRPERDADHPAIAEVVRAAFVEHPDEVASFVERIRTSEEFIPELALVAEDSSGVIAHVMLSWVGVEGGSRTRILNPLPHSSRLSRLCKPEAPVRARHAPSPFPLEIGPSSAENV
ncbi:MAG TPA: hypothetical protein VHI53_09195 [Gaiellaceae bacterium]|jgi:hypothetical protein|nr:hypothetical protein [Gaiellaceae bacterium]